MRIIDPKEVLRLLQSEVEEAGSQAAWARRHGLARSSVNRMLKGAMPLSDDVIRALRLRIVIVSGWPANAPWRRLFRAEYERWLKDAAN